MSGGGAVTSFSDDFNRADGDLTTSPNWTLLSGVSNGLTISSNAAANTGNTSAASFASYLSGTKRYIEFYLLSLVSNHSAYIALAISDSANYLAAKYAGGQLYFTKRIAGAGTNIITYTATPGPTDLIRYEFDAVANTVRLLIAGSEVVGATPVGSLVGLPTSLPPGLISGGGGSGAQVPWIDSFKYGVMA